MTSQLPATFAEAEACAYARNWIARNREPDGLFHHTADERYGKATAKEWMKFYPSFGPDDVVYFAENGYQPADEALREVFAEYVQRGEQPPVTVAAYNIRLLNPRREKPGPRQGANFLRDFAVAMLAQELNEKFGLAFYKNPASNRPTVSGVAAPTLTEAGIGIAMGPKAVEKIWRRFAHAFTGIRPRGLSRGVFG